MDFVEILFILACGLGLLNKLDLKSGISILALPRCQWVQFCFETTTQTYNFELARKRILLIKIKSMVQYLVKYIGSNNVSNILFFSTE